MSGRATAAVGGSGRPGARRAGAAGDGRRGPAGGGATLMSYCPFDDRGTIADVPDEHWEFLQQRCVDWFETSVTTL